MAFTLTAAHPLVVEAIAAPVVYLVVVAVGRWLKRSQRVPLGVPYQLLAIALAVWLPLVVTGQPFLHRAEVMRFLSAAVVLLGTLFGIAVLHRYYWEGWFQRAYQMPAPKFLRQVVALLVFLIALLVVLQFVLGADIRAALAASGVAAVVLGLAMQEMLANIISGIALQIGKPFKIGDWLIVEGQRAEVIEVNWRSTKLRTNDHVYLDIPNKAIVTSTITNLTYPTRQHGVRIIVGFEYSAPPNVVKDCLARAAANAAGVTQPPPKVFLKDFADSAILYEIRFFMEDEARYNDICDAIRTTVWYEAQRQGLRIPFPIRTLQIERRKPAEDALEVARRSAKRQPILQLLDDAQLEKLCRAARLQRFGRGEKVIEQGSAGDSMFILLAGQAEVRVRKNEAETPVATLETGDAFGEMSLLTGEPRSATVVARRDCELWEIGKEPMRELLEENTALVERLGELLAQRRLKNEGLLATTTSAREMQTKQDEYTQGFLRKLSAFFEL